MPACLHMFAAGIIVDIKNIAARFLSFFGKNIRWIENIILLPGTRFVS